MWSRAGCQQCRTCLDPGAPQGHDGCAVSEPRDATRTAGRGLLSIAGAKIFFIVSSYAIQLTLPRVWTDQEYGLFSATIAGVSILNNILIASTIQSVSKFVSADERLGGVRLRQGLEIQLVAGGLLAAALLTFAPQLAAFFEDDRLSDLFRVASAVVFSYALYAAVVGSLNGRHQFQRQARLDITFSVLRTAGILGTAVVGLGVMGAVTGFAVAATAILTIALVFVGSGERGKRLPLSTWLSFMAPIWLYQAFLNGMLQADILVLKKTLAELGQVAGLAAREAADRSDAFVGRYRAAQTFAFVPYQLLLSMTFIVFPMISKATSLGDVESARSTIRGALRFSLLMLLAIAAPIAGAADGVILIAFPADYVALSGPALRILVMGMVAFSLFVIGATILSGAGRPAIAAGVAAVSVAVVVVANRTMVMAVGIGDATLETAATATTIGTCVGCALASVIVWVRFKALVPPATVIRAALAGAAAFATAWYVPHGSRVAALGALVAGALVYGLVLVVTGELGREDLAAVKKVIRR